MSKPDIDTKKKSDELILAYKTLSIQNKEKEKRAAELITANKELVYQKKEKAKRAAELITANKELVHQNKEKAKRAKELIAANKELVYQKKEKVKRAAELIITNKELVHQNEEKDKCAEELIIANKELLHQNEKKEKWSDELATSTVIDVTERKKNEENLAHLAAIVESSENAIITKSLSGTIKSWNKRSEKMFGYTAKEAIGQHISLIIPPERINEEKEMRFGIRNDEKITHIETVRNKKSGEQFFVSLIESPLKDSAGIVVGISKIAHDITEQKKAEKNLQNSIRELSDYKYALEESCIVAITDPKGIIKYANDNFCKISKYNREELIGQDHRIINSGYHSKEFIRDLWLTIANGKIWKGELKNKAKDESIYWVDTTIVPFLNEKGKPYQYMAIRADITARKRDEELITANIEEKEKRAIELNIVNKELTFQNEENAKRAVELVIANKELEQFSYIASHDLQEPLRTVSNYMKVFEEVYLAQLDNTARKYLERVNNATRRMSMLIKSLLDFSRLGHNIKFTEVDCKKLIYEVITDLDRMIETSNAAIEVTEMPQLNVYETEIRQLFQNLIINAIKFRRKDTQIEIRISSEKINDEQWKFSVSDNGIGIDPVHFERIFDIFQRLPTDEIYEGIGIGLANCKKIVQFHGGKIWVESNPIHGATFHFTILNSKI